MQGDSLICLRSEFVRLSCKRMLQQLHDASGNSRFLWKAWDRELGGLGHPTACFLKHSSVAKSLSGVKGLAHGAAEKRNNQGLLTQQRSPRAIPRSGWLLQLSCDTKQSPLKISSQQNLPHSHRGKGGNDLNLSRDCKAVRTLAAESPGGGSVAAEDLNRLTLTLRCKWKSAKKMG